MNALKDKVNSARSPRSSVDHSSHDEEADKYRLLVTAGPSYDTSTHQIVRVNTSTPTMVENQFLTAAIKVRIRGYRGLPSESPMTSPYFDDPMHTKDQYSIAFSFVPKIDLPSVDTAWGNDFDHPVRDRLPPGFNTAFRIVKDFIDPGLECDAYADEPWIYGPSLSCWFAFGIGDKIDDKNATSELRKDRKEVDDVLKEGADSEDGWEIRRRHGLPDNNEKRRKHFLSASNRQPFVFEQGRTYHGDFYNPYLDFGNFALKLPGFSIRVIKYIDDKSHRLRYVFKNRKTGDVYFCVNLNLLWGDELRLAMQDEQKEVEKHAGAEQPEVNGHTDPGDDGAESGGSGTATEPGERESESAPAPSQPNQQAAPATASDELAAQPSAPAPREEPTESNSQSERDSHVEPGLRDKPPALAEEAKKMSIQDTLQDTASADRSQGRSGLLDDGVD